MRHFHLKFTLLLFSIGLVPVTALAATYYVSPAGSDSNSGASTSSPWQHIGFAVSHVHGAGESVIAMDGTYGNEGKNNDALQVVDLGSLAGSASSPITIKAQNRGKAILDGGFNAATELSLGGTAGGGSVSGSCKSGAYSYFNIHNASYVLIQGFVFQNLCAEALHSNDTASHITIQWNDFGFIGNRYVCDYPNSDNTCQNDAIGISANYLDPTDSYFTYDGNTFHDIGRTGGPGNLHFDHAIYTHGTNVTFINNVFYNITKGWCIQLADGANNVLIENNTFALSNVVTGEDGQIMFWNSNLNLTIRNNIFYRPTHYALNSYTPTVSGSIDTNLIFGVTGVIANTTGLTIGSNKTGADPLFVNATAAPYNFNLQSGSPAIDAGATISAVTTDVAGTTRPQGAAYDMGAYEFASGSASPVSACDINSDGTVTVADVQLEANMTTQVARCTADINLDSQCNVIDLQRVVNAALGGQCVSP